MDLIILENESLSKHTTFKIGGNARYFACPKTLEQVLDAIKFAKSKQLSFQVLGNGSNVLATDDGYSGVIISMSKLSGISIMGNFFYCKSGALLSKCGNFCLENSMSGFERLCGIPGTIGGAVSMNAGAYGGEITDILVQSTYMDIDGNITILKKEDHDFSYRHSFYTENPKYIILEAVFELKYSNKTHIKSVMDDCKAKRIDKQPINFPSAGSTFKRPTGYFAGKLIEDAGLKGYRVGGACVSQKHSGFVINDNNATCKDVLELISDVKKKVFDQFQITLECEIKVIGD